ncbi:aldolase [Agarivorans aestuarii]|uniref:class II aldolase/adducin family protein n=1 Tax=Agarivorans aestuarii TaxID=1563703 RepID=UPI001C7F0683|nr:aldolase [Agarivorans aestuarii]
MNHAQQLEQAKHCIIKFGLSIFQRGLTGGASANMSIALDQGFVVTPTNSCFGFLEYDDLSVLDAKGDLVSGKPASKEFLLHQCFYQQQPAMRCVLHLHSTYATAVSCLKGLNKSDAIPALTPYLRMRLGAIAMVDYHPPGSTGLVDALKQQAANYRGVLMANHGPIVAADSPEKALYAMEELEESCKLQLLLGQQQVNYLNQQQVEYLQNAYKGKL